MKRFRIALAGTIAVVVATVLPSMAAADCSLSGASNANLTPGTTQAFQGHFGPSFNGKFIQVPFDVAAGTKGMRIRYCFEKSNPADDNATLDLGVYEAKPVGASTWSQAQRRGWSGSALRTVGIGENGYSDEATYNSSRKGYVAGRTTRAFKPGPIGAGQWAVEFGAGWIDPDGAGVDWRLEVVTTSAQEWADDPFVPDPYAPNTANSAAGWYTGDLHAHGEMEPGNAPMNQTFNLGFGPLSGGGNGLDFITLVDHNNDNARSILGSYQAARPGKLIIPGVEVTTYNGHVNAQGSSNFADFRFSQIYRWDDNGDNTQSDSELTLVREPITPASQFQSIIEGGGFTQVNHPETAKFSPAACRGCAWTYDDAATGWDKVNAMEIQNGPAAWPANQPTPPTTMNPFTTYAIQTYERLLAAGHHIAAVGSSDDHQGGDATGGTDSPVGRGATVVYADQLSQSAIVDAVKADHTYVKLFGADGPDVELKAGLTGKADPTALPGDSLTGPSMTLQLQVRNAGPAATRPGVYTLETLKDGTAIDSTTVVGDDFSHALNVTESGRYSFKLTRPLPEGSPAVEAYSTPVWFTSGPDTAQPPSHSFSFKGFKANRKAGTAILKVKVTSPGRLKLSGKGLKNTSAKVGKKNQVVTLKVLPKAGLKKKLKRRGVVSVRVKVTNTPNGGKALSKSKNFKLRGKKARR